MTANVYYADDADPSLIHGKKVAVIGYGSQGHGHALNLKDSGVDVIVGLREGSSSIAKAEAQGLKVLPIAEAAAAADVVMMLAPDTEQKAIYDEHIAANLDAGQRARLRPRLQRPLRPHRRAGGRRRDHDRPEGPGPPRAPHVHRGRRRADAHRRRAGRHRPGQGRSPCRTPTPSAAPAPASSRRRSPRRPRPTCSASRSCCAAA